MVFQKKHEAVLSCPEEELWQQIEESQQLIQYFRTAYYQTPSWDEKADIVIAFVKQYPFAPQCDFVIEEFTKWCLFGRYDFFERLSASCGERKVENKMKMALKSMAVYHCGNLTQQRTKKPLYKTFEFLSQRKILGEYLTVPNIRKLHYKGKQQNPFFFFSITGNRFTLQCGPTIVTFEDK